MVNKIDLKISEWDADFVCEIYDLLSYYYNYVITDRRDRLPRNWINEGPFSFIVDTDKKEIYIKNYWRQRAYYKEYFNIGFLEIKPTGKLMVKTFPKIMYHWRNENNEVVSSTRLIDAGLAILRKKAFTLNYHEVLSFETLGGLFFVSPKTFKKWVYDSKHEINTKCLIHERKTHATFPAAVFALIDNIDTITSKMLQKYGFDYKNPGYIYKVFYDVFGKFTIMREEKSNARNPKEHEIYSPLVPARDRDVIRCSCSREEDIPFEGRTRGERTKKKRTKT